MRKAASRVPALVVETQGEDAGARSRGEHVELLLHGRHVVSTAASTPVANGLTSGKSRSENLERELMSEKPGFFERLSLAFRVLGDAELAARVKEVGAVAAALPAAPAPVPAEKPAEKPAERVVERVVEKIVEKQNPEVGALHLLAILQRDGRLMDFLLEDIAGAGDADVGAGARVVHAGCRKALHQYFTFEPVRKEGEGATIVVDKGFDPAQIRLAGNVGGEPPFKGKLAHAGWKAVDVRLPDRPASVDARVVAPAEVEI